MPNIPRKQSDLAAASLPSLLEEVAYRVSSTEKKRNGIPEADALRVWVPFIVPHAMDIFMTKRTQSASGERTPVIEEQNRKLETSGKLISRQRDEMAALRAELAAVKTERDALKSTGAQIADSSTTTPA